MIELPHSSYDLAAKALSGVKINHLFAKSVFEGVVDGTVYVDKLPLPNVYYIKHPYGMSLVWGDRDAFLGWHDFWKYLEAYSNLNGRDEWLQVWPEELSDAFSISDQIPASDIRKGSFHRLVEPHERLNFGFERSKFLEGRTSIVRALNTETIVRTGSNEYDKFVGSVVPDYFWRSKDAFLDKGVGFSLITEGVVASTVFSAFIHGKQVELGIETNDKYQGRGYAYAVCCRLIDYCLELGYEPVWSCRMGNTGSVKLAMKLGFYPTKTIPYFRIKGLGNVIDQ
jgi:hypothetical protein